MIEVSPTFSSYLPLPFFSWNGEGGIGERLELVPWLVVSQCQLVTSVLGWESQYGGFSAVSYFQFSVIQTWRFIHSWFSDHFISWGISPVLIYQLVIKGCVGHCQINYHSLRFFLFFFFLPEVILSFVVPYSDCYLGPDLTHENWVIEDTGYLSLFCHFLSVTTILTALFMKGSTSSKYFFLSSEHEK